MAECTRIGPQELERREKYMRARDRQLELYDPWTWTYPYKTAGFTVMMCGVFIGLQNLWYRKPWYYALYPRLLATACFALAGFGMGKLRAHHYQTRDAVVEHYMQLHPHDFERLGDQYGRPYSQVFMPWRPVRAHYGNFNLPDQEPKSPITP